MLTLTLYNVLEAKISYREKVHNVPYQINPCSASCVLLHTFSKINAKVSYPQCIIGYPLEYDFSFCPDFKLYALSIVFTTWLMKRLECWPLHQKCILEKSLLRLGPRKLSKGSSVFVEGQKNQVTSVNFVHCIIN